MDGSFSPQNVIHAHAASMLSVFIRPLNRYVRRATRFAGPAGLPPVANVPGFMSRTISVNEPVWCHVIAV